MAYFRQNEPYLKNLRNELEDEEQEEIDPEEDRLFFDSEYTDEPEEPEEEPLTEEELSRYRKHRIRMMFNAGNMTGILVGCVLILILITLLFSMVNFVWKDFSHSFSLFQIKF